ncbi:MAG: hypothetical protein KKF62_16960 [Bacteroidetes bacterium]|nr:hypothetical protein [Bacteroidota bacterium]MBU1116146.1 hypothetical protein [Bacteroidota bacterium]MBU1800438.1 hypothetical protein [Bacteroidota bacterium]
MMLKKILFTIVAFIFITPNVKSQNTFSTFYISPGISISWGGDSNILFGWKLSFGYTKEEKYYYNITYGKKYTLNSKDKVNQLEYKYLEIQIGSFLGYYPLSAGGGLGMTLSNSQIYPRLSLFAGAFFFGNFDYTFNKNIIDLGGNINLPIPFKKEFRDLGPG